MYRKGNGGKNKIEKAWSTVHGGRIWELVADEFEARRLEVSDRDVRPAAEYLEEILGDRYGNSARVDRGEISEIIDGWIEDNLYRKGNKVKIKKANDPTGGMTSEEAQGALDDVADSVCRILRIPRTVEAIEDCKGWIEYQYGAPGDWIDEEAGNIADAYDKWLSGDVEKSRRNNRNKKTKSINKKKLVKAISGMDDDVEFLYSSSEGLADKLIEMVKIKEEVGNMLSDVNERLAKYETGMARAGKALKQSNDGIDFLTEGIEAFSEMGSDLRFLADDIALFIAGDQGEEIPLTNEETDEEVAESGQENNQPTQDANGNMVESSAVGLGGAGGSDSNGGVGFDGSEG